MSEHDSQTMTANQIIGLLKEKWARDFVEEKRIWDENPGWPAKLVGTAFVLHGGSYHLGPEDIGLTDDGWDQGFMESIQPRMEADLRIYGATDVCSFGFVD